jgi:hypothetical protein
MYILINNYTVDTIALFQKAGFHIAHAKAYDMFPQTTHLETVVQLKQS